MILKLCIFLTKGYIHAPSYCDVLYSNKLSDKKEKRKKKWTTTKIMYSHFRDSVDAKYSTGCQSCTFFTFEEPMSLHNRTQYQMAFRHIGVVPAKDFLSVELKEKKLNFKRKKKINV